MERQLPRDQIRFWIYIQNPFERSVETKNSLNAQ